ncbi:PorV/PorQ family protein [bacterium]|nr:PorV/PorQ family protein [bacterium]
MPTFNKHTLRPGAAVAALLLLTGLFPAAGSLRADDINSSTGTTALNFLKTAVGARAAALGTAYTALSDDAAGCFWNPAGLTDAPERELFFTHQRLIADMSQSAAAYVFDVDRFKVGVSMNYFSAGELERRETNSVEAQGTFSPFDMALGVSAAMRVNELVSAGVTARWVHENLDSQTASAMLFDIGVRSRTIIPGLSAALSVRNLGTQLKYENKGYDAPREVAVGASYHKGLPWARGAATVTAEIVRPNDNDARLAFGAEYGWREMLYGRVGYRSGLNNEDMSFGFGIVYMQLRFDYAFVPYVEGLGDSHRFSFNYSF